MRICEKYKDKSYAVNVLGVQNLREIILKIKERKIKLIQISSDAVYPSIKGNYSENSKLKPQLLWKNQVFIRKNCKKIR